MLFFVRTSGSPQPVIEEFPHVILVRNDWDDYGFRTRFTATLALGRDQRIALGDLRILQEGQTGGQTKVPSSPFTELGSGYCSVGRDLGYYMALHRLEPALWRRYLTAMSDVAYNDEVKARFEDADGYRASLLRPPGAESTIEDAGKLFRDAGPLRASSDGFPVKFKTKVAKSANSFTISFDFTRRGALPHRINAVIGYNGTGKTRLLSNLAVAASGTGHGEKADILAGTAGRFIDESPPFKTVIVISYSAFDTFAIPPRSQNEKMRADDEIKPLGYVYCGLRERADAVGGAPGSQASYRLLTQAEIEAEFLSALLRVKMLRRLGDLMAIAKPLLRDASFQRIGTEALYEPEGDDDLLVLFQSLSSGHKFVLKIVAELTAYVNGGEPTLVLIDEPETHLHPPLLAALLKSVRACLDRFDGYAVVVTHSPVVLQEMPSRYVHVLKRVGGHSQVAPTAIETFGESIGVITQDVFNLDDGSTDWHDTLVGIAKDRTLNELDALFGRNLGFGARSYVVSALQEDGQDGE